MGGEPSAVASCTVRTGMTPVDRGARTLKALAERSRIRDASPNGPRSLILTNT